VTWRFFQQAGSVRQKSGLQKTATQIGESVIPIENLPL
jgi:hypothetical protein